MGTNSKTEPNYAYDSITPTPEQQHSEDAAMRPKMELGSHPQLAKPRTIIGTFLWQTLGVLWLVPVIALIYLNFTEYIIGASAWCPHGHCWADTFNFVSAIPVERAKKFDKESHNLIGGLQFVAKGLEIWFGIVAASLMYLVVMREAGKKEGLPIGYLTRPMEFADPITILDGLLWKTGPSPFGATKTASEKRLGRRVWYIIGLSLFLCVLINLMGPATAVLVIPALQWVDMPRVGSRMFEHLNAASPPQTGSDSWYWYNLRGSGCLEEQINAQNYSCTQNPVGISLDAWLESYAASLTIGQASQGGALFSVNKTAQVITDNSYNYVMNYIEGKQNYRDYTWWVPSRQMVNALVNDYTAVNYINWGLNESYIDVNAKAFYFQTDPASTYVEYNKSLELSVSRNGPIVGTIPMMWADYNSSNHWTIEVDANRQIRCYNYYSLALAPLVYGTSEGTYTKCIRTGTGWNPGNQHARFYTEKVYNSDTPKIPNPGVNVDIYTSDKAAFFLNGQRPSWLPEACLTDGPVLNKTICPWERMFTTEPDSYIYNRTQHVTTIEFTMGNGTAGTTFVADFVAFEGFTRYYMDVNPVSNPLNVIKTGDLPSDAKPVAVDLNWYLAAWSIAQEATLPSSRPITALLQEIMEYQLANPELLLPNTNFNQDYVALLPIFNTLSLIDYTSSTTTAKKSTDPEKPLLQRWAQIYVWSYGLGSRTSHLGVAVALAGCIVVIWQFLLGFTDRRRYRSPTQLIVAALEHAPRGEFTGKNHDELAMARVRFHIKDNDYQAGKYSFYEPEDEPVTTVH